MKVKEVFAILILLKFELLKVLCDSPTESLFCENSDPVKDVAFLKIGTYKGFTYDGAEYQKTYFVGEHVVADWFNAKLYCESFGLELATFETLSEAEKFIEVAKEYPFIKGNPHTNVLVDGMTLTPRSKTDWYWTRNGEKIPYTLPWRINEPNFQDNLEYCLDIVLKEQYNTGFNDVKCQDEEMPFICQRIDYFIPIRINY